MSSFHTVDGLRLATYSYLPEELPRASVTIVHGYAEHAGRHKALAEALVEAGYAVYTFDLRGHGKSEGKRANVGVFNEYVHDLSRFSDIVRESQPPLRRFLFGHSMGGAVALQLALEHPEKLAGLILSAPFLQNATPVPALLGQAAHLISNLFPDLPVQRLDTRALSRDEAVVQAYQDDPLVYHGKVKARLGYELLRVGSYLTGRAASIRLPVLLQHGTDDRIASKVGTEVLSSMLSGDRTLKLYSGAYHEIYKDDGREAVLADLLSWLSTQGA